jgi:hypothetical protein
MVLFIVVIFRAVMFAEFMADQETANVAAQKIYVGF